MEHEVCFSTGPTLRVYELGLPVSTGPHVPDEIIRTERVACRGIEWNDRRRPCNDISVVELGKIFYLITKVHSN